MIDTLKVTFLKALSKNLKLKGNTGATDNFDEGYILHLASWYPNKNNLNEGIFIQNQVRAISKRYTSILLSVIEEDQKGTKKQESNKNENLIEYIVYQPKKMFRQLRYFMTFWTTFLKIKLSVNSYYNI